MQKYYLTLTAVASCLLMTAHAQEKNPAKDALVEKWATETIQKFQEANPNVQLSDTAKSRLVENLQEQAKGMTNEQIEQKIRGVEGLSSESLNKIPEVQNFVDVSKAAETEAAPVEPAAPQPTNPEST